MCCLKKIHEILNSLKATLFPDLLNRDDKKTLNYLAMLGSHQDIKWKMTWNVRSHALDF